MAHLLTPQLFEGDLNEGDPLYVFCGQKRVGARDTEIERESSCERSAANTQRAENRVWAFWAPFWGELRQKEQFAAIFGNSGRARAILGNFSRFRAGFGPYPSRTLLVPFSYPSTRAQEGYEKGTRRVREGYGKGTGRVREGYVPKIAENCKKISKKSPSTAKIAKSRTVRAKNR